MGFYAGAAWKERGAVGQAGKEEAGKQDEQEVDDVNEPQGRT